MTHIPVTVDIDGIAYDEEAINADLEEINRILAEKLGTTVGDFASGFGNALQNATSVDDFLDLWGDSLESITKQALINAFLESTAVKGAIEEVS